MNIVCGKGRDNRRDQFAAFVVRNSISHTAEIHTLTVVRKESRICEIRNLDGIVSVRLWSSEAFTTCTHR